MKGIELSFRISLYFSTLDQRCLSRPVNVNVVQVPGVQITFFQIFLKVGVLSPGGGKFQIDLNGVFYY